MAEDEHVNKKSRNNTDCSKVELKNWLSSLTKEPVSFSNVEVKSTGHSGLGLFAAHHIPSGQVIATIPHEAVLTPTKILQSEIGLLLADFPAHFRASAYLAVSLRDPTHPSKTWLESLPKTGQNVTCWSEEELELLKGTNLGYAVEKAKSDIESHFKRALGLDKEKNLLKGITLSDLVFAAALYDSRRFPLRLASIGSSGKDPSDDQGVANGEGVMVPLLDFGNHSSASTIQWQTDEIGVKFSSKAKSVGKEGDSSTNGDIRQGEEIFNNYGEKGNEELLMAYGFALENNDDDVYSLVMSVGTAPPPAPMKQLGPFHISLPVDVRQGNKNEIEGEQVKYRAQFPPAMFRAMLDPLNFDPTEQDNEEEFQIDVEEIADDVENFYYLLNDKRQKLNSVIQRNSTLSTQAANQKPACSSDAGSQMRRKYIEWYLAGQLRVLNHAIESLGSLLGFSE